MLCYPSIIWQGIGLRVEGRALILRDFFMGCSWVKRPGGRGWTRSLRRVFEGLLGGVSAEFVEVAAADGLAERDLELVLEAEDLVGAAGLQPLAAQAPAHAHRHE